MTTETTVTTVIEAFQSAMHLPDPGVAYLSLATIAANRQPGDAVSLIIVAPPSSGKSETIQALSGLPEFHAVSTVTVPGLLSIGVRPSGKVGTGGLLRQIDRENDGRGVIGIRDLSTMLESHSWAETAAFLRDVLEGHADRFGGAEGGRSAAWLGHVAIIAAVTGAIDRLGGMAELGDRFVQYRLPDITEDDDRQAAIKSDGNAGRQAEVRDFLAQVVARFFDGLVIPDVLPPIGDEGRHRLVTLAMIGTRCRSAVPRHGYTREQEDIPGHERSPRLYQNLRQLLAGMVVIGVPESECWRLIAQVALDGMRRGRRKVLDQLVDGSCHVTDVIAMHTGLAPTSAQRHLEDLAAHGVVSLASTRPSLWQVSTWLRASWWAVTGEQAPAQHLVSESHESSTATVLRMFPGSREERNIQ